VYAARDRSLHGAHAFFCGAFCKALDFVMAQGGHFDPGCSWLHAFQKLLKDFLRYGGRWQAGDDAINFPGERLGRIGPFAFCIQMASTQTFVDVVDGNVEAVAQEAGGEMATEIAQTNVAIPHTFNG
jgi:hypothetical protein